MRYQWLRIRRYLLPVIGFGLNLVTALFWVALRVNHSGISKFLGADTNPSFLVMNLPVMVCAAAWLSCGLSLLGLLRWEKRRWPGITALVLGIVFAAAAAAVIYFGAKDYLRFILPHFFRSLAVAGGIVIFALLLWFPIRGREGLKAILVAAVVIAAVVIGYQLRPCVFTYGAVVYAVEDEYQIVFSTSDNSIAWVEIDGKPYYELYAGSMKSADRVHKVIVPQETLDAAGGYTLCAKQMIYRGPFGGYTGKLLTREYDFRPVDSSDGLSYFALSDVHEAVDAAAAAARGEHDFIVLLGDLVSMVETEKDAQLTNELAHRITGGEIPVIYARGNHEIKGEYAEVFHKYVGASGEDFYYTVTLGEDVFAVVLDMGEDHEDDWWEYYGTAFFDIYREAQSRMLEEILAEGSYENYRYRMVLCHIPVVYVDADGRFGSWRQEWTALLNQLDPDISLSGHEHRLYQFLPGTLTPGEPLVFSEAYAGKAGKVEGGTVTDFNFPSFLVGRRSLEQAGGTQGNGYSQYVGMQIKANFTYGEQIARYINSQGHTLTGSYPFAGAYPEENFRDIITGLKRP